MPEYDCKKVSEPLALLLKLPLSYEDNWTVAKEKEFRQSL